MLKAERQASVQGKAGMDYLEVGGLPDGASEFVGENLDKVGFGGVPVVEDGTSSGAARVLQVTLDQADHQ